MGSAASKRDANGGSGSSGSGGGRSLDSKRTLTKKQKKKQQVRGSHSGCSDVSTAVADEHRAA